jgi:Uma2 family endonuclease
MREQHVITEMSSKRPATYEEVLAAPEHLVAEILDGELVTSPRPALPHADASSGLLAILRLAFDRGRGGPGGWRILAEPELHLGNDILVPDIAGWRRSRLPHMPANDWLALAPDWVCEVLSPSTTRIDRTGKLPIYAREDVNHAWLVDPIARIVEVLRRERSTWILAATVSAGDVIRAEPFDAIEIDLRLLWDTPPIPDRR